MKKIILAVALTLGLSGAALAYDGPLSYDYVQGTVVHENQGTPANGIDGTASFDLANGFYAEGDVRYLTDHSVHGERYQAGLGYHFNLSNNVSAYGQVSAVALDSTSTTTKYGYDGEAGLRIAVTPKLELGGAVEDQTLNLADGVRNHEQTFGKVSAAYFLTKDLAVVADYRASAEERQVGAGVRYTW
jgi:opacity protein-like surface antigen